MCPCVTVKEGVAICVSYCVYRLAWRGYRESGMEMNERVYVSENDTETSAHGIKCRDPFFSRRV